MCLAIPAKVVGCSGSSAVVDIEGVRHQVQVDLLTDMGISVGDYVLAYAGIAVQKMSVSEAQETLAALRACFLSDSLTESERAAPDE